MNTARRLSDAAISGMTVEQLNAGLRSYREDLRYTRADAVRAVETWNRAKMSTVATVIDSDGLPFIVISEATQ